MKKFLPDWLSKHWKFWIFVAILFVLPLFISAQNVESLKYLISGENAVVASISIFFILVLTTVIAPLNSLALVPFSAAIIGWEVIFLVSVLAWTVGATIAFLIARHLGAPALRTLGILDEVSSFASRIPGERIFTGIILLRILVPVDILSYALGFVTTIPLWRYILATLIGVIPGSFIWSYIGVAAFSGQLLLTASIIGFSVLVIFVVFYFFRPENRAKK